MKHIPHMSIILKTINKTGHANYIKNNNIILKLTVTLQVKDAFEVHTQNNYRCGFSNIGKREFAH